jgi:arsenate reductase
MIFQTEKPKVIFYEKTGCSGNDRQKKLLRLNSIDFEVKSILDTTWDKETLGCFFENLEKKDMINQFAPQIKNNKIDISQISKDELIKKMCETPILIKRPLLEIGEDKIVGFDIDKINTLLGSKISDSINIFTCLSSDNCTTL